MTIHIWSAGTNIIFGIQRNNYDCMSPMLLSYSEQWFILYKFISSITILKLRNTLYIKKKKNLLRPTAV